MKETEKKIRGGIFLLLVGVLLFSLSCNLSGDYSDDGLEDANDNDLPTQITLECAKQKVVVSPGENTSVPIQIKLIGNTPPNLELHLEAVSGEDWQTALCYASHCFISEGMSELVKLVTWTDPAGLEIKFLVPSSASSGNSLLLRLTVIPGNRPSGGDSIEISGYVP